MFHIKYCEKCMHNIRFNGNNRKYIVSMICLVDIFFYVKREEKIIFCFLVL